MKYSEEAGKLQGGRNNPLKFNLLNTDFFNGALSVRFNGR